jgi:fused signal recognition particle receptor
MSADKTAAETEAVDKDQDVAKDTVVCATENPQEAAEGDLAVEMPPADPSTNGDVAKSEHSLEDEAEGKIEIEEEPHKDSEEKDENKAETEDAPVAQETVVVIPEAVDEAVATEAPPAAEPVTTTEPAVVPVPSKEEPPVDPLLVVEAMRKLCAPPPTNSGKAHFLQYKFNALVNQVHKCWQPG